MSVTPSACAEWTAAPSLRCLCIQSTCCTCHSRIHLVSISSSCCHVRSCNSRLLSAWLDGVTLTPRPYPCRLMPCPCTLHASAMSQVTQPWRLSKHCCEPILVACQLQWRYTHSCRLPKNEHECHLSLGHVHCGNTHTAWAYATALCLQQFTAKQRANCRAAGSRYCTCQED